MLTTEEIDELSRELDLASNILDDMEAVRMANEARLRQMTKSTADTDGGRRGWGFRPDHPDVARLTALVAGMNCKSKVVKELGWQRPPKERGKACCLEHEAEKALTSALKRHPLGHWPKNTLGVGDKQFGRLLAATGDPYWNTLHNRPRLVSELWSFCGYGDAQTQRKRKKEKISWSPKARSRAHVVVESINKQLVAPCRSVKDPDTGLVAVTYHVEDCACSPYRVLLDDVKARYLGTVHPYECAQCSPKKAAPAPPGSPRKQGHVEAIAYRAVAKQLLKDMWVEAARLHGA